jgi:class 3 adenylate cyclase
MSYNGGQKRTRCATGSGHDVSAKGAHEEEDWNFMKPTSELLAVFCTDIEGSSVKRRRFGDEAMDEAIAKHNGIIEQAVSKAGGTVFKLTGDGVYAAFANPLHAVRAAIAVQHAMLTSTWTAVGGLEIRIAVNFGSASKVGGDYLGKCVNRAGKLLPLAHGGQIIVTEETKAVVRAEDSAVEFRAAGAAILDDPNVLVEVHQVVANGLKQDFPPLRSARPQAPSGPVATPDGRTYRVKRCFTEADKTVFRASAFRVFRDHFRKRIDGLATVPSIAATMEDISARAFTCMIINQARGSVAAPITVHRGADDRWSLGDISYSFAESASSNSANGWLTIDADDYELYLNASFGLERRERLSPGEAAELLWNELVKNADIGHDQDVEV